MDCSVLSTGNISTTVSAEGISIYTSNTDVEIIEEDREIRQCRHI